MGRVTIRLLISLMTIQPWRSALLCFRCREDRQWAEITEMRVALHVPSPRTHSREAMPEITATVLIFIRGSHNTALSHCLIAACQVFLEHCQSNSHSRSTRSSLWNKLFRNHSIWVSVQSMCLAGALLPGFWSWTGELSSYPIASNYIAGCGAPCCMVRQCRGLQNIREVPCRLQKLLHIPEDALCPNPESQEAVMLNMTWSITNTYWQYTFFFKKSVFTKEK